MSDSAPIIRIGFIGLSSSAGQSAAGQWGSKAHLPYLSQSSQYTITAVCNSSVEAAGRAIALHRLDTARVRAYGDAESLANDDNVDLVVCCVRVARHYELCKPALLAGKMVYCEWPLAANLTQMTELASLAETKHVKTAVGLQGRMGAYVPKIRDLIGEGEHRLGPVLSTNMNAYTPMIGSTLPEDIRYVVDIKSGGNILTISSIHLLDTLTSALGDITGSHSVLGRQRKTVALLNKDGSINDPAFPATSFDHVMVHGTLSDDIVFNFALRRGLPFKDTPGLDWRIYCLKGEIRLTLPTESLWLAKGVKMEVYRFDSGEVEEVDFQHALGPEDVATTFGLQAPADNVARIYDAFSRGETDRHLDFQRSLKWARFVREMYTSAGAVDE